MTERQYKTLACELSMLSVFRGILFKKPMEVFLSYLGSSGDIYEKARLYGEFVYSLADYNYSFSDFLKKAVYEDENKYIVSAAKGCSLPETLKINAQSELGLFSSLTRLDYLTLAPELDGYKFNYPRFDNTPTDIESEYQNRISNIGKYGYGIFAASKMFRVSKNEIVPVAYSDDVSLDMFVGYKEERQKVFENTKALALGRTAANVLLFGDAGTGKSSTVKACANFFFEDGVRLIELRKDQLFELPYVMGKIADNPLKFIIFIDDLSFNKNDDSFSMLKAALEGSASAKAKNAVIYATSNRRHIVKESFSDRSTADDIHHSDTVEELMSLSDRFGITVYFAKPNKALYLEIVHALAKNRGIIINESELDVKAEAFALAKGSRSPRAAEQFVLSLL